MNTRTLLGIPPVTTATEYCTHTQQFSASRLPKLTLPMFSGSPLDWLTFWGDSFRAAIHLSPNLSGVQKFNYLKTQLQGDAAEAIEGFPLIDQSYLHAVAIPQDRFGQTHQWIDGHMQALLELSNPTNSLQSTYLSWCCWKSHSWLSFPFESQKRCMGIF